MLAVSSPMLKALVILLVETGLRVGKEAMPLKWTDIDLSTGTLCVRESKTALLVGAWFRSQIIARQNCCGGVS